VNRSAVNQLYVDAVLAAGGAPLVIPLGLDVGRLRQIYDVIDGLLLPGGDDVAPERYGQEPRGRNPVPGLTQPMGILRGS